MKSFGIVFNFCSRLDFLGHSGFQHFKDLSKLFRLVYVVSVEAKQFISERFKPPPSKSQTLLGPDLAWDSSSRPKYQATRFVTK